MDQIDNYIQSFLNGSLDAEGHILLRQWINEKPENRDYFRTTVVVWKATGVISNAEEYRKYVIEVPDDAKSKITFPDGSVVWLNAGSKVKYDSNFAKTSRNVELTGEGYFEVSKNKDLPFVM